MPHRLKQGTNEALWHIIEMPGFPGGIAPAEWGSEPAIELVAQYQADERQPRPARGKPGNGAGEFSPVLQ
jgi:hypothetical protein